MKTSRKIASFLVASMLCIAAHPLLAADYGLNHSSGERTIVLSTISGHQFSVDGEGTYDRIGNINVTGGTLNIVFNTSDYIYLAGCFQVTQGTLHLSLGAGYTNPINCATLMRASGYDGEFFFVNNSSLVISSCNLIIQGDTGKDFVMDGGCKRFRILEDNNGAYNTSYGTNTVVSKYALVISTGGTIDFDHVVMRNNYNNTSSNVDNGNRSDGGAMNIRCKSDGNANESGHIITMDYCTIDSCYSRGSGGAFRIRVNNNATVPVSSMAMNNCQVRYCYSKGDWNSQGGVIRTWGASRCGLSMSNCTIHDNYNYDRFSTEYGMFHWNAFEADTLRLSNCVIDGNWNRGEGGGLNIVSIASIEGCQITNNRSGRNGGGLCYTTYTRIQKLEGLVVNDGNLILDDATVIENNSAAMDGGGLFIQVNTIQNGPDDTVVLNPQGDTLSMNLIVNGATIRNNSAQNGGGVYMTRTTDLYHTDINLNAGEVASNSATLNGGGMYAGGGVAVNVGVSGATQDSMNIVNNTAVNGGGLYLAHGNINIYDGNIGLQGQGNVSQGGDGGGVYVEGGRLNMQGGCVSYNKAVMDSISGEGGEGGGFYVNTTNASDSTLIGGDALIAHNLAEKGGGAYIQQGVLAVRLIRDDAPTISNNTATSHGGGIYLGTGNMIVAGALFSSNTSDEGDGGGAYVGNGTVNFKLGTIMTGNKAVYGGGICLYGGEVIYDSGSVKGNEATMRGGGVYVSSGNFMMNGGTIGGILSDGNKTTNNSSYGGGLYMNGGVAIISNGAISGNQATNGYGGGIYMNGGSCTLFNGATIGGTATNYANSAQNGGGIYSSGGIISVEGGDIAYNTATKGGGIYSNGPTAEVYVKQSVSNPEDKSIIEFNSAGEGGGIYAEKGFVEFSDGTVRYNRASVSGGGMYIDSEGSLILKGTSLLMRNHVPWECQGGGVYLKGTLTIGEELGGKDENSIRAEDNFAFNALDTLHPDSVQIDKWTRNNVYLPEPVASPYTNSTHRDVITVVENGIGLSSKVGFTVPRNMVPVIYCDRSSTSWSFLDRFTTGPGHDLQKVLFDDEEKYISVHYSDWLTAFDPDHVYLFGYWPEVVDTEPEGFDIHNINTREDLAWLITIVNGKTDDYGNMVIAPDDCEGVTINLNADLDMSEYGWVPIGQTNIVDSKRYPFKGTFNGNGHTVAGLMGLVYEDHYGYGFFGNVEGGTVQDVYLNDVTFMVENTNGMLVGPLVAELHGDAVLSNCEAVASINAQGSAPLLGGAVGRMGYYGTESPIVHSICATTDMMGGNMGGLVGEIVKGELYNSFAHPLFTSLIPYYYYGGLVGINSGTVENCYVRLRGDMANPYFGKFVGRQNANGNLQYCYAPTGYNTLSYYGSKADGCVFTNYRDYDYNAETPYLYLRRDVQVHVVEGDEAYIPVEPELDDDKQMLHCLNKWVEDKNNSTPIYTTWLRPTTTVINGDYPILRMPVTDAVACAGDTNGGEADLFLHYGQINDLIEASADTAAICLYRSNANVNGNGGSGAKLYIAEGVTVIQNGALNAYVGVTLDNSAGANGANPTFGGEHVTDCIDWHMFSTPLAHAPLGVKYVKSDGTVDTTQYLFSFGHSYSANGESMPYYQFYDESECDGYFPSHVYGTTYVANDNATPEGVNNENYYQDWDYYTYYEPEYHWVNFKRNSKSHWHQDLQSTSINYQNEDMLVVGKGYLLATSHPTYLQCYGLLNGNEAQITIPITYNNYFSAGYNFLGNPYLAYLDFDSFAVTNADLWACDSTVVGSYAILDEDSISLHPGGYKYYAYNSSKNADAASRYIAPHQGFMIKLPCVPNDQEAYFTPDMRSIDGDGGHFRNAEQPAYPLVNLFATDATGNRDITTVELGRPDRGGALMMRDLKLATCHVWCHYEDRDWAVAFTKPGLAEVPIRFEAYENGAYTLTWNTQNGDFSYLHLIDNMTGVDVDCLAENEYRFEASTTDYRSRFRLLFGYTGIEENQENADQQVSDFAFQSGDELVVNGEGMLRMFDVTGRQVMSQEVHGAQTSTPVPDISVGVYLLQLDTVNGTRVQKIVIK